MQFSFTRFYHLFIKQWKENKKTYGLGLISMPLLIGVTYLIIAYSSTLTEDAQGFVFLGGMILFGGVLCSSLLGEYTPKSKGIRTLILPTSPIEKLLVAISYGLILYPILYVILVYPVLKLVNYIDYEIFGNLNLLITADKKFFTILFLIVPTFLSFTLLSSLFYRRLIFIKTAITCILLIFTLSLTNTLINATIFGDSQPSKLKKEFVKSQGISVKNIKKVSFELTGSNPFSTQAFHTNSYGNGNAYISPSKSIDLIGTTIFIMLIPVMLISCFFRLKEIEL